MVSQVAKSTRFKRLTTQGLAWQVLGTRTEPIGQEAVTQRIDEDRSSQNTYEAYGVLLGSFCYGTSGFSELDRRLEAISNAFLLRPKSLLLSLSWVPASTAGLYSISTKREAFRERFRVLFAILIARCTGSLAIGGLCHFAFSIIVNIFPYMRASPFTLFYNR